jgi:hypothetical protein
VGNVCATVCLREGRTKMEGGWTIKIDEWWDDNILAYILLLSFLETL